MSEPRKREYEIRIPGDVMNETLQELIDLRAKVADCEADHPLQDYDMHLRSDDWLKRAADEISGRSGIWTKRGNHMYPPVSLPRGEVLSILRKHRDGK